MLLHRSMETDLCSPWVSVSAAALPRASSPLFLRSNQLLLRVKFAGHPLGGHLGPGFWGRHSGVPLRNEAGILKY